MTQITDEFLLDIIEKLIERKVSNDQLGEIKKDPLLYESILHVASEVLKIKKNMEDMDMASELSTGSSAVSLSHREKIAAKLSASGKTAATVTTSTAEQRRRDFIQRRNKRMSKHLNKRIQTLRAGNAILSDMANDCYTYKENLETMLKR